ncbi:MAG: LOG family protein [Desulfobulbus propionicus]|nr:MAG: LOG family protein [Desulfobulbus propionicus]
MHTTIPTCDAVIEPERHLKVLSRNEVAKLHDTTCGGLYQIFRSCSLAVLNNGDHLDDGKELLARYQNFDIRLIQEEGGIRLQLCGAPENAFVDGVMIKGIREHLFSVLRDVVFINGELHNSTRFDLQSSDGITDAVFHILRNANVLRPGAGTNLAVCWGGHAINQEEYDYSKEVGYELGLRGMDICTGCGPGAMKGPMKGAAVGHAKQRNYTGQYLGITEPGIIAAESPNPIVNDLVIMPDIEKRLEAFVRSGHAVVVFPGGAGTLEEILYLLSILLTPENARIPFPLIFSGPRSAEAYFTGVNEFIGETLGIEAQQKYRIILDDPATVAREVVNGRDKVHNFRREHGDAFYFNWLLHIRHDLQQPFAATHEDMRNLHLYRDQPPDLLAATLRKAFSGIVSGNVKESGISRIEKHGLFELHGEAAIIEPLETLLESFISQQRMRLPGTEYVPCYTLVRG